jgi:hypothetical protein
MLRTSSCIQQVGAIAFVVFWEAAGLDKEQYEAILRPAFQVQPSPPGLLMNVSGPMERGWRGITIWESQADTDAFGTSDVTQQAMRGLGEQPTFTTWHASEVTM